MKARLAPRALQALAILFLTACIPGRAGEDEEPGLELSVRRVKSAGVVATLAEVSGEMTRATAPQFSQVMDKLLERDVRDLIVSCAGIKRTEKEGPLALRQAAQAFAAKGGRIVFCNVSEQMRKDLKESNLDKELMMTQDVASALKTFAEPPKPAAKDEQPPAAK